MRVDEIMTAMNAGVIDTMTNTKVQKAEKTFSDLMDNAVKNNADISGNVNSYISSVTSSADSKASDSKDYMDKSDKDNYSSSITDNDKTKSLDKDSKMKKLRNANTSENNEDICTQIENVIKNIVAQQLGITVEELDSQLASMDMNAMDLLDSSKLLNFIMEYNGIEDISFVLTDENLMNQFKDLTEDIQFAVEDVLRDNNVAPDELPVIIENIRSDMPQQEKTDSRIVVEVENEDSNSEVKQVAEEQVVVEDNKSTEENTDSDFDSQTQANANSENEQQETFLNTQVQHFEPENIINGIQNAQTTVYSSVQMEDIINQIVEQVKVQVSAENTSMEMQLNPESFGKVQLHVALKDGMVTAQMTVENENVKNAIESQLLQLKESMNSQGVKVEAVEVTVETHEFDRNLQQDSNANQQAYEEEQKKNVTKRMNLNLLDEEISEDDAMDLSEAELLERNMMMQSGNRMSVQI